MYWLFLVLALGAFLVTISTTQTWLLVLSALATLLLLVLWVKGLYVNRIGNVSEAPRPLHPAELQALREQFRAQQAASAGSAVEATVAVSAVPPMQVAADSSSATTAPPIDRGSTQP